MSIPLRRVLIVNTHSVLNSGDASIVLAQAGWLKNAYPGCLISLTSRTPKADRLIYEPLGLRVIPSFYDVPSCFSGGLDKWTGTLSSLIRVRAKTDLVREISRADLVIGSGGGYFYSNRAFGPGPMFLLNILHLKTACLLKKPVILFPQSFGPVFDSRSAGLLRNLLVDRAVKRVLVREENSLRYLDRLLGSAYDPDRFVLCPDMAFLLPPGARAEDGPRMVRPATAVTVRSWDFPEAASASDKAARRRAYFSSLEETLVGIHRKRGGSIVLFPQSRGPGAFENDRPASLRLYRALQPRIPSDRLTWVDLPDVVSPGVIDSLCARADLLLATRFHSAILALQSGTPVLSLNYQPKSSGMMGLLGLRRYSVDLADARPEILGPLAEELLEKGAGLRSSLLERVGRIRETAERVLRESLEGTGIVRP